MKLKVSSAAIFSVVSVIAALILGAFILLISGESPLKVYYCMIIQPLSSMNNILNVFYVMTPLIIAGLAFIVAINASMVNLGIEGQMLFGSITVAYLATLFPNLPWFLYIPLVMLAAMVVGALWAILPGFLKLKFGASEIVTCIMLNYVAQFSINYIVSGGVFKHPTIDQRTPYILPNAHMMSIADYGLLTQNTALRGIQLNGMFVVALVLVALIYLLLEKTKWGYKIKAVGLNLKAATANRLDTKKILFLSMGLSGAIAGLVAMGEVLGTFNGVVEGFSPGYGFSGISVALLGRNKPIGVILGALFFGILNQGMVYIGANTSVPKDFVKVLQTLIIIFIVLSPYFEELWNKLKEKRLQTKEVVS